MFSLIMPGSSSKDVLLSFSKIILEEELLDYFGKDLGQLLFAKPSFSHPAFSFSHSISHLVRSSQPPIARARILM
jgi:hypothetical protein